MKFRKFFALKKVRVRGRRVSKPGSIVSMRKTQVSLMHTRGAGPFLGLSWPARSVASRPHAVSDRCFCEGLKRQVARDGLRGAADELAEAGEREDVERRRVPHGRHVRDVVCGSRS